ncbi:MAG: cytoplasmic protein [Deltaproteobacteria bacterium]|nr:MAG: cytoplasmic protein [Deltaproteobacteria bacterium]
MRTRQNQRKQFDELQATALFCPKCQQATPVRQRLLLFLPDGELHEYLCQFCGTSVGTKKVTQQPEFQFLAH